MSDFVVEVAVNTFVPSGEIATRRGEEPAVIVVISTGVAEAEFETPRMRASEASAAKKIEVFLFVEE
jgi:hypothetical protein